MSHRRIRIPSKWVWAALSMAILSYAAMSSPAQTAGEASVAVPGKSIPSNTKTRLDQLQEVLKKAEAEGDTRREGGALILIGEIYLMTGDSQAAMNNLSRALPIVQSLHLKLGEANVLMDTGSAFREESKELKALEYYERALPLFRELHNRRGESNVLNNFAIVYYELGENQKALDCYTQALAIFHDLGDHVSEALVLNNLGRLYHDMGQGDKAIESLNQAILLSQQTSAPYVEGRALKNIGNVYRDRRDTEKALESYNKALAIMDALGDRSGQAMTLDDVASLHAGRGEKQVALKGYRKALSIATATAEPLQAALINSHLMHLEQAESPALAIYYGKRAVNLLQEVRGENRDLDEDLQKSFLNSKEDYYHDLADLLIARGRLREAQQVLDLLKQQEYKDYVRGDAIDPLSPLSLSPAEQRAEAEYQKSTAEVVASEQRWTELKKESSRTPDQEAELQSLSKRLETASLGLNQYYARLYQLFAPGNANNQLADVKGNTAILNQVIAGMPRTVALYTAVAKGRYSVIVISGIGPAIGRKYDIAEKDLNQKIAAFQQALRTPTGDPRAQAQELYKILIGPIQADLDRLRAETLVWSLDGSLRYIPIAALYDGRHYIVENYNIVAFTPASVPFLRSQPNLGNLRAVAMGISRKYEDGLDPLPAVVSELDDIVTDPNQQGSTGVMPGTILLNGQFTEKAMEDQLGNQHAIVHIASHFVLQPGDDGQSYLLLAGKDSGGSGYHLTVADFRDNQNLSLIDTELLTLSACETGVSSTASNGREVDGLAATAQLKGAKSVISTLWEVSDTSTGELMADFYRRWSSGNGKVAKVEALRQAQLDLLQGRIKPKSDLANPDAPTSFAHPFFWAPFVLMGNWK